MSVHLKEKGFFKLCIEKEISMTYYSYEEVKIAIEKYIKYYSQQRIKEKLGWMSPVEYRINLFWIHKEIA